MAFSALLSWETPTTALRIRMVRIYVEEYAVRDEIKSLSQLCRRNTGCGSTYNGGIDKCTPAAFVFEQGEDKGNGGGAKQDDDELIFELL